MDGVVLHYNIQFHGLTPNVLDQLIKLSPDYYMQTPTMNDIFDFEELPHIHIKT